MTKENEVALKQNTAVGQVLDFSSDAGAGLEGADAKSFAIPFISLLQGLSPQCEPVKDGGIEGAKPGLFINSITNELFEEILVIPAAFRREFLRWAPRSSGGGFKGSFPAIDVDLNRVAGMSTHDGMVMMDVPAGQSAYDEKGMPKYDILTDTRNHFVLAQNKAGGWFPALVSLSSTQIKKSKKWMSLIQGIELNKPDGSAFNPPSFSHIYKLSSVKEENAKGKWQGVQVELHGQVTDATVYARAKKFNQDAIAGQVETSPPAPEAAAENTTDKF